MKFLNYFSATIKRDFYKFFSKYSFILLIVTLITLSNVTKQQDLIKETSNNDASISNSINNKKDEFMVKLYAAYLKKSNMSDYLDELIKSANSLKMSNYICKSKVKMLKNKELEEKVFYLNDYLKQLKTLDNSKLDFKILLNSSENDCSKEEALLIGTLSKISFDNQAFIPIGVSNDVENISDKDWKAYIVLMALSGFENRLSKVCFSNKNRGVFIKVKFDEECSKYIAILYNNNIFPKTSINKEINNKIKEIEKKVFENQINNNSSKESVVDNNDKINVPKKNENESVFKNKQVIHNSSFLETSVTSKSTSKLYSVTQLADKFSVDELSKIKSIIKFAKKNKITDKIYNNKGDITLEELLKEQGKALNSTETGSVVDLIKKESSKIDSLESTLKLVLNEITDIKGKIANITSSDLQIQKSSEINRLSSGSTGSSTQIKDNGSLSRLIASTTTDEFGEEDDFIDKPKKTSYSNTGSSTNSNLIRNKINSNASNSNLNRSSSFSPSKSALKAKPLPSSHLYSKPAPRVSASRSPAPAAPSTSFNNQQFKQTEKVDDYDDDEAFLSP